MQEVVHVRPELVELVVDRFRDGLSGGLCLKLLPLLSSGQLSLSVPEDQRFDGIVLEVRVKTAELGKISKRIHGLKPGMGRLPLGVLILWENSIKLVVVW